MSFPLVRARVLDNPGLETTSIEVTKPALLAAGELWLVAVCARNHNIAFTWPAGWTQVSAGQDNVGGLIRLEVRYRVADGTETNITVSRTSAVSQWAARSWRISAITGTPQGTGTTGDSTNANPPSLSPSWGAADTLWLAIAALDNFVTVSGFPAGYDNTVANGFVGSSNWVRLAAAERQVNVATENPGTFTSDTEQWVAATIGIRPGVILSNTLDPMAVVWTGADLTINARAQIATEPAALTWTAAPLTVNAKTQFALDPALLTWTGQPLAVSEVVLVPMALTWTGLDLAINAKTQVVLTPAALTWTGQNTTTDRWVGYTGWEVPRISGETVIGTFATTDCIAIDRSRLLPADSWAEILVTRPLGSGVVIRAAAPDTQTLCGTTVIANGVIMLFQYVAGVFTDLAHSEPQTTVGQRLRVEGDGATVTGYLGTSPVVQGLTAVTAGGFAGIRAFQAFPDITQPLPLAQDPAMDDFAAGDFSIQQGGTVIDPMALVWTGQNLTVNALTELILDAAAMTWTGQNIVISDNPIIPLAPMALTWTGMSIPGLTEGSAGGRRVGPNRLVRA